jgi:hypothetical protein
MYEYIQPFTLEIVWKLYRKTYEGDKFPFKVGLKVPGHFLNYKIMDKISSQKPQTQIYLKIMDQNIGIIGS